jgi:hypothetical protein
MSRTAPHQHPSPVLSNSDNAHTLLVTPASSHPLTACPTFPFSPDNAHLNDMAGPVSRRRRPLPRQAACHQEKPRSVPSRSQGSPSPRKPCRYALRQTLAHLHRVGPEIWQVFVVSSLIYFLIPADPFPGDISHAEVLGQHIIILNNVKTAVELLDKKSSSYSDRPVFPMGGELVGWKNTLVLLPYGDRFREYRKNFARVIGSRAAMNTYHPVEEMETHRFLQRVLAKPAELSQHIRHTAGAIILRISHGYQVKENQDPFVDLADKAVDQFSASTVTGAFMVDVIPACTPTPFQEVTYSLLVQCSMFLPGSLALASSSRQKNGVPHSSRWSNSPTNSSRIRW